jgi:hypothetical protein
MTLTKKRRWRHHKTTLVEKAGITAFDNAVTTQGIEEYSDVLPEM